MRIVQTKGIVKDGELKAIVSPEIGNGEVNIILQIEDEQDDFENMRQMAKDSGYDSQEKIIDLIHKVKLEMLAEK